MMVNMVSSFITPSYAKQGLEQFSQMSNAEMLNIAQAQAINDEKSRKNEDMTRNLIKAVPVVDSMLAVSQKNTVLGALGSSLSGNLGTFAGRLASWGILLGGFDVISKGIDKLTAKSKTLSDIQEKHPLTKSILDLSALFGIYSLGKKAVVGAVKNLPTGVKDRAISEMTNVRIALDSSKLSQNIYKPMMEKLGVFLGKHQNTTAMFKKASPYIVPAMIIGSLFKSAVIDPIIINKKVKENFIGLKLQQEAAGELAKNI